MNEYISKGNAIFAVSALPLTLDAETTQRAIEAVRSVRAADVVEVRRSVWVGIDDYPYDTWECANCGRIIEGDREAFCPSCGAVMVNEDEDIPMEYFENGGV